MSADTRTFTVDTAPPLGERIDLWDQHGDHIVWTGKRWYDPRDGDGSLQTQEAWPPDGVGPWTDRPQGATEPVTEYDPVLTEALDRFGGMVATDPRDWSLDRRDAWIFGLMCGWDCEADHEHGGEFCEGDGAMREVAERHHWSSADIERLRRYRAAIRQVQETQP